MAGRYFTVPITALAIAAIGMAYWSAASASASAAGTALARAAAGRTISASAGASKALPAPARGFICLTNASSNCVSIQLGTSGNAVLGSDEIIRNVVATDQAGHWEAEIESVAFPGDCLADTGLSAGVHANWQACGANGTVWILVPHTDGAYMESRFAVNRGILLVLSANAAAHGAQLYVGNPSNPGGPWQTWSFFAA